MRHFVMGTAGHAGHGKTALIRALTGSDAAREWACAQMRFDETLLDIVDMPGGMPAVPAAGADMMLLVVAADEGVTGQTLQHLRILSLLNISRCVVVITKTDLADEEEMEAVRAEVRGLYSAWGLPACSPVAEVSARTGRGIERLLQTIVAQCALMPIRRRDRPFYMHVDRLAGAKGLCAVGTVREGAVSVGEEILLCPGGQVARVCAIRGGNRQLMKARAGQRVAMELASGETAESVQALSAILPGVAAGLMDARVFVPPECGGMQDGEMMRITVGTAWVPCRVYLPKKEMRLEAGESCYAQLEPQVPFSALSGERFLLWSASTEELVGGGILLDVRTSRHVGTGWRAALARMSCYEYGGHDGMLHWEASAKLCTEQMLREHFARWSDMEFRRTRDALLEKGLLVRAGELLLGAQLAGALKGELIARLTEKHAREPLEPGLLLDEARQICPGGLLELCIRDGTVRLNGKCVALPLFDPCKTRRFWQIAAVLTEADRWEPDALPDQGVSEREARRTLELLNKMWPVAETG